MYHNKDDFSGYGDGPQQTNYADPSYYSQPPRTAQPEQALEASTPYTGTGYDGYAPTPSEHVDYVDHYEYANVVQDPQDVHDAQGSRDPRDSVANYDVQAQEYKGLSTLQAYTQEGTAQQQEEPTTDSSEKPQTRKKLTGIGGLIVTIGGILLKFNGVIFLLKFAPALISAAVSIVIYSIFFGWTFAFGIVASLFIHEMGHALVMKLKGIPVGGLIFVPLLGAAVTMRQMPANAKDEAEVGIAGPIAGALAASVCLMLAYRYTGTQTVWAPLAYFGFFINLFNLVPIVPFDGGRVLAAIDRRIWILGFVGLLAYEIWLWSHGDFSFFLLFFIIIAASQLWMRSGSHAQETQAYYDVPLSTRITLGLVYFGLAVVLVLGMTLAHNLMAPVY